MKAIKSIYVAGKMENDAWRRELFDPYPRSDSDHAWQLGYNPVTVSDAARWPRSTDPETGNLYSGNYGTGLICGLAYTGPFFVDLNGGHGFSYYDGAEHGANVDTSDHARQHGAQLEDSRKEVQSLCFQAIARADVLFAYIDCIDCYGTIAEIGYAKALGKIIWIAGSRRYDDLWFVYSMANEQPLFQNYSDTSLKEFLSSNLERYEQAIDGHFSLEKRQELMDFLRQEEL